MPFQVNIHNNNTTNTNLGQTFCLNTKNIFKYVLTPPTYKTNGCKYANEQI